MNPPYIRREFLAIAATGVDLFRHIAFASCKYLSHLL
jgi:hypothetical protein